MARGSDRRLFDVAVEPAASELLHAVSNTNERPAGLAKPMSSLFALNFNFKPDSTHECKRGAFFQPGPSRSDTSEWHMELEAPDSQSQAESSASDTNSVAKKPAHVFTGPQTGAKAYDLVLIWDDAKQTYRLDRMAASFALKYERSRTTLSDQAQKVWTNDFKTPRKRVQDDEIGKVGERSRSPEKLSVPSKPAAGTRTSMSNPERDGARPAAVVAPLRRSSRRSIAVEMEEFDDPPPPRKAEPADADDVSFKVARRAKTEHELGTVRVKAIPEETAPGELRRSRRRSSQQWQQPTSSKQMDVEADGAASSGKVDPVQTLEGEGEDLAEEEDLALELERELEREFDLEILSEDETPAQLPDVSAQTSSEPRPARKLSPVSRLRQSERQSKISTPKAHTPDIEDATESTAPSLMRTRRALSPRATPGAEWSRPPSQAVASIGLGLQQTGVGITPTASPHLDVASPTGERERRPRASPDDDDTGSGKGAFDAVASASPEREDDDDDDLQDFAAELDMSLAEGPEASPVIPSPAVEKRRSSRVTSATQMASDARSSASDRFQRNARKAYGLGGPRQEEEDLEDSD